MDQSKRQELHRELDEILDRRAVLVHQEPTSGLFGSLLRSGPDIDYFEARGILVRVVALAREIMGNTVRRSAFARLYDDDSEQRALLRSWLLDLWPLIEAQYYTVLGIAPKSELTPFDVIDGLSALDAGEIRPLFLANTGKNRRANRWSLAHTKLEALVWKERLRALGHREKDANFHITTAFGEQWDTIRKWKSQCEQILGSDHVRSALHLALMDLGIYARSTPAGMFGSLKLDPLKSLETAGRSYKAERERSAALSKAKNRYTHG